MKAANELIPTRQSLLSRLKNWDDQESWRIFFETYWKLIYNAAIRSGLGDAEAQDVVQETLLAVSKHMPSFHYDPVKGSFKSWLLRLTSWRIFDQLRRRQADCARLGVIADPECVIDPVGPELEKIWEQEWETNLLEASLNRVKRQVDARQYQIFDLYVIQQWPLTRVVEALKVNRGRVYLAKHRVGKLLKKEITHLQEKPL